MSQELEIRVRAIDEASQVFEDVGGKVEESLGRIKSASEAVKQAEETVTYSTRDLVTGFSGLATSAFSLYMSLDRIEKAQYAVEKAHYAVEVANRAVEEAQRRYNQVVEKYGVDSEQARAAAENLRLAQEKYELAVERANIMQNNLNQTMMQVALSVVPTMITMIDSGVKAYQNLHAAVDMVNKVTAFFAANPVMAAIAAIGALVGVLITAYQTCEPFRNAVNAIGEALYNFFKPAVEAVANALNWFWNNILRPLGEFLARLFISNILQLMDAVQKLKGAWDALSSALKWIWDNVFKPLADFLSRTFKPIIDAVAGAVNAVKGGIDWLADALKKICFKHATPTAEAFRAKLVEVDKQLTATSGRLVETRKRLMDLSEALKSGTEALESAGINIKKSTINAESFFKTIERSKGAASSWGRWIAESAKTGLNSLKAWAEAVQKDIRYVILWFTKFSNVAEKAQGLAIPFPDMPPALEECDKMIRELGVTYEGVLEKMRRSGSEIRPEWIEALKEYFGVGGAALIPPAPPAAAAAGPINVNITVQGVNEEIARYVRSQLVDELKDTLVVATSSAAPATRRKIILPKTFA